jgi:tetratricopeptide (TPR) repeat protein
MTAEPCRYDDPPGRARQTPRDRSALERTAAAARLRGATEALSVLQGRSPADQRRAARFATALLGDRAAPASWADAGLPLSAEAAPAVPAAPAPAGPAASPVGPGVPLDHPAVLLLARCAMRLHCAEVRAADRPAYWAKLAAFFARHLPADSEELIRLRQAVVNVRLDADDTSPEVIAALSAAIDYCRRTYGEDAYLTGLAQASLSTAYRQRGTGTDLADATALAGQLQAARTARYGPAHPVTLVARSLLALSLLTQAEATADPGLRRLLAQRALTENTQVLAARDRVYGVLSAPAAVTRRYQARARLLLGEPDKARACLEYTVVLERARGDRQETHSHGQTHYHLSRAYRALGRHEEAREHAERARAIFALTGRGDDELRATAALMEELTAGEA